VLTWVQETKGRTSEEIGSFFGDENIASYWYVIREQEGTGVARNALQVFKSDRIPEFSGREWDLREE
jgi:hypothetical protein